MLYEAQFRNPAGAGKLIQAIRDMDLPELRIMEICGTHTMSIAKAGLRQILPPHIHLISGPGCPVCVTPSGVMDEVLRISQLPNVTITTYGDDATAKQIIRQVNKVQEVVASDLKAGEA